MEFLHHSVRPCTQAPVKPKSAVGEMLAYYYQAQPHLFKEVWFFSVVVMLPEFSIIDDRDIYTVYNSMFDTKFFTGHRAPIRRAGGGA